MLSKVNNHICGSSIMQIFLIPASFEWEGWEKYFPPSLPFVNFETENWGRNFFSEGAIWSTLSKLLHKSFCHFTIFPNFIANLFLNLLLLFMCFLLIRQIFNLLPLNREKQSHTCNCASQLSISSEVDFFLDKNHTHASQ